MINPYEKLSIDPFAVAHKFEMPAALFEAFKKTMCGGNRGHKDAITDYTQAIDCLQRYKNDVKDKIIHRYVAPLTNQNFLEEVKYAYVVFTQQLINVSANHMQEKMLRAAYLAGVDILNLYCPAHAQIPTHHIVDDAIANLNAALFYASKA